MNYQDKSLQSLKLGQATEYAANYDRTLLQPVPRKLNRDGLGITEQQPFTQGADIWTAYEISWLNPKGLPQVAIADVEIDYRSENLNRFFQPFPSPDSQIDYCFRVKGYLAQGK